MIKYNYEVSVNENRAKLNKDIFLFRGNRNIHYYFSIKGARFTFSKENEDLLESSNAIYAAVTVVKPNGVEVANAIAPVEDGLIHLKVTEDLIDEEVEVGDFDLVFDLFDDNEGAVTIPKIKGQFHVQERPCTTSIGILSGNVNVVNQAVVDLAIATQENEQLIVVDDDGKYVKTTWAKGDKISVERLNKMEEGIYNNSSRLKNIGTGGSTNASDITITDVNDNFESANVEGALNELGTQYKDIANEKIDNVTLSNNVLTFFANSKTIKTITLPTSTTGGGTNGKEIELQKSTTHIQWRYVGDTDWNNLVALTDLKGSDGAKGDKGDKGDTGTTPNLQIGTVETLDSGSNATASITGTVENPLLNLGIPKGADGESGTGTGGSSEIWKKVIETTFGEDCYAFTVTKDKDDNGLQIKEGFIFITASQPKDTSSNLSFGIGFKDWESSFNGKATIYSLSLYKNYEFYRVGFYFKVINNFVFTQYLGNNRIGVSAPIYNNFNSSSISNANMTSNFRALLNNLDYIDKITVGLDMSTTGLFSKDSIMEVWAKC